MRRLVFDQSSPVHPVSESKRIHHERDGAGGGEAGQARFLKDTGGGLVKLQW